MDKPKVKPRSSPKDTDVDSDFQDTIKDLKNSSKTLSKRLSRRLPGVKRSPIPKDSPRSPPKRLLTKIEDEPIDLGRDYNDSDGNHSDQDSDYAALDFHGTIQDLKSTSKTLSKRLKKRLPEIKRSPNTEAELLERAARQPLAPGTVKMRKTLKDAGVAVRSVEEVKEFNKRKQTSKAERDDLLQKHMLEVETESFDDLISGIQKALTTKITRTCGRGDHLLNENTRAPALRRLQRLQAMLKDPQPSQEDIYDYKSLTRQPCSFQTSHPQLQDLTKPPQSSQFEELMNQQRIDNQIISVNISTLNNLLGDLNTEVNKLRQLNEDCQQDLEKQNALQEINENLTRDYNKELGKLKDLNEDHEKEMTNLQHSQHNFQSKTTALIDAFPVLTPTLTLDHENILINNNPPNMRIPPTTIFVKSKQGLNIKELKSKIESFATDIRPKKIKQIGDKLKIRCKSVHDRDVLLKQLNNDTIEAEEARPRRRRLIFFNINEDQKEEDILRALTENDTRFTVDDCTIIEQKGSRTRQKALHYVVELPLTLALLWEKKQFLFLGLKKHLIRRFIKMKLCNKCQSYNHSTINCTNLTCCGTCAEDHHTSLCTSEIKRCVNCIKTGQQGIGHTVYDHQCPTFKKLFESK